MLGNKILKFSRIYAIVLTVLLVLAGFVLLIVGFTHQKPADSWYSDPEPDPIWGLVIGGFVCFPLIAFVWMQKIFIDGFGLIVLSSENNLKKDNVKSYLDEVAEEKRIRREEEEKKIAEAKEKQDNVKPNGNN